MLLLGWFIIFLILNIYPFTQNLKTWIYHIVCIRGSIIPKDSVMSSLNTPSDYTNFLLELLSSELPNIMERGSSIVNCMWIEVYAQYLPASFSMRTIEKNMFCILWAIKTTSSISTYLCLKFIFVGKMPLKSLHMKFLNFDGIWSFHICFHSPGIVYWAIMSLVWTAVW